jgi:type IV secretion system protein VirB10
MEPNSRPNDASVRNLAAKPPGILPKNAQTLVIAGISVVMIAVIALSGGSSPRPSSSASQPKQQAVIDPNAARIAEYRNRIEEQARKLAAEQTQLSRAKQALGVDPGGGGAAPMAGPYVQAIQAAPPPAPGVDERARLRDQLEVARQKREHESLFASNVALSYRIGTTAVTAAPAQAPMPTACLPPQPVAPLPPTGAPTPAGGSDSVTEDVAATSEKTRPENVPKRRNRERLDRADGPQYRLFEGTVIESVLTNRLTGSLAGPVNCMVTTDVYSHDRQRLLIPQGSRALGEVKPVSSFGQQRLAVIFHRLIMPDGFSVDLDQFRGLNQIGETGLRDQVNRHYLQTFGVSLAIGAIAGLAQANTRSGFDTSSSDAYRQGVATSLSQSSLRILDRYLNILPTFTVREGHRIKIYLADDLLLPAYDRHRRPGLL